MKQFATRDEFRRFAEDRSLNERVQARASATSRSPAGSTFLSHSSKDDELVDGAIRVLEGHGGTVYVDKVDPTMPPYTTTETASKLKDRMKLAKKFVLLASENSKNSKWVPWELGIADGYKTMGQIAIFSAVETPSQTSWTSWEYMGLYRQIIWSDLEGYEKPLWIVWDRSNNTGTPLSRWLQAS